MVQNLAYSGEENLGVCPGGTAAGCDQYGRRYQHHIAMNHPLGCDYANCSVQYPISQGICPEGWRIPSYEDVAADILPIDTSMLESYSLKNQFAGSISKSQGYEGDPQQEWLGLKLSIWIKPLEEFDLEAPVLKIVNSKTTPADADSERKYFSMSVRCVQE